MFDHERALVQRYSDRPFALIGINSDKDLEQASRKNRAAGVTWRSFWNGPKTTSGPISTQWRVRSWPTLFLIDHDGIIRHRWVGNPGNAVLDKAIEALVRAAERPR